MVGMNASRAWELCDEREEGLIVGHEKVLVRSVQEKDAVMDGT